MLTRGRTKRAGKGTARDPEATRARLLRSAQQEVYRSGYQGTDLDRILRGAGVTKGALYHHFPSKEALGYAVVDEALAVLTRDKWLRPLEQAADPLKGLIAIVEATPTTPAEVSGGCPVNNLAQEMAPLDPGFQKRLARNLQDWQDGVAAALAAGQKRGQVHKDLDPREAATFFVAAYEGYVSLAKAAQDGRVLRQGKRVLRRHLESLRPPRPRPGRRGKP